MKTYLSVGDFHDLAYKTRLRGTAWLARRLRLSGLARTVATWDETQLPPTNWWTVPAIRERWNTLATGKPDWEYQDYVTETYLKGRTGLAALSVGSGTGTHDRKWACHPCFSRFEGLDLSPHCVNEAIRQARIAGLTNLQYRCANIYTEKFTEGQFDVVIFHSSLHHFKNLPELLTRIRSALAPDGLLVIHEYTGPDRLQWTTRQLAEVNRLLAQTPLEFRLLWGTNQPKHRVYCPGIWRMIASDPSEAVASSTIVPTLRKLFKPVEEKPLGGNLLHLFLKDIAHHFSQPTPAAKQHLHNLMAAEDQFLATSGEPSDFLFGIYRK
jgi:SAM-dependent methyltransferase